MATFEQLSGETAIDAYLELLEERPEMVGDRSDLELITDRQELLDFAAETADSLGLVIRSPFNLTVIDLVESDGHRFPYIRTVPAVAAPDNLAGVVAVAMTPERDALVMIETFRHATGKIHLELPRGFLGANEDPVEAACRELREESGFVAHKGDLLAKTYTDTGASSYKVAFVRLIVEAQTTPKPEITESISRVRVVALSDFEQLILDDKLGDAFAMQAAGLLASLGHLPSVSSSSFDEVEALQFSNLV